MKKYVLNKNVWHNEKEYPKGSELKPGMDGFEDILKAGHCDVIDFSEGVVEPEVGVAEAEKPARNKK